MRIKYIKYAFIAVIFIALGSCDKKADNTNPDTAVGSGNAILKVNLLGVLDDEQVNISSIKKEKINMLSTNGKKTYKSNGIDGLITTAKSMTDSPNGVTFDALTTFEQSKNNGDEVISNLLDDFHGNVKEGELKLGITSKDIKSKLQAASTPLAEGKRFKLLIFDGTTLVNSTDATNSFLVGGNISIAVDAGKTYNWYAYSTDEATVPAVNSSGIIARAEISNKNFMFASGTITNIPDGDNNLSIILRHKMVRYIVDLDVKGMFGTVLPTTEMNVGTWNGTTFTNIIESQDFNILTNSYTGTATAAAALTGDRLIDVTTGDASIKRATYYSTRLTPIPANILAVQWNKLDVQVLQNDGTNYTREFTDKAAVYPNAAFTPAFNTSNKITTRLIELGYQAGGRTWARTNLIYDPAAAPLPAYRFRSTNDFVGEVNKDYWNWRALTTALNATAQGTDPCSLVYPTGIWRTPAIADFVSLGTRNYTEYYNGLFFGAQYFFGWDTPEVDNAGYTPENSIDNNPSMLIFTFGGQRLANGSIDGSPAGVILGLAGAGAIHYWSWDENTSNNSYGREFYGTITQLANFVLLGTQNTNASTQSRSLKTVGKYIRCLRG